MKPLFSLSEDSAREANGKLSFAIALHKLIIERSRPHLARLRQSDRPFDVALVLQGDSDGEPALIAFKPREEVAALLLRTAEARRDPMIAALADEVASQERIIARTIDCVVMTHHLVALHALSADELPFEVEGRARLSS